MRNYYTGMMNTTGGSELRHHGILGQKWGVRRFQNQDGSLTPAGRERYNVKTEKYIKRFKRKGDINAYRNLSSDQRAQVDKLVKKIKKDEMGDHVRDSVMGALFGTGAMIGYKNTKFFEREERREADEKQIKEILSQKYHKQSDVPKGGMPGIKNGKVKRPIPSFYGGPKNNEDTDPTKLSSSEMYKRIEKYKNLQNTKSLFGDHTKDSSVQVLKEYHKDLAKNEKSINDRVAKAAKKDPDSVKDAWKDARGEVVERHIKKYAEAVLKDMGYDANPGSVAWLLKQGWFTLDGNVLTDV